jgi:hypothetical protein
MLAAKLMAKQLIKIPQGVHTPKAIFDEISEEASDLVQDGDTQQVDPDIPEEFWAWATTAKIGQTHKLMLTSGIFSPYEISRQVPLMFALNLLATAIDGGFFSRNERTREFLETYSEGVPDRNRIVDDFEFCCGIINRANFGVRSYWKTKANTFSLIICLYRHKEDVNRLPIAHMRERLDAFVKVLPSDYQLSAKEAVNRRRERALRHMYLESVIFTDRPFSEIRPHI